MKVYVAAKADGRVALTATFQQIRGLFYVGPTQSLRFRKKKVFSRKEKLFHFGVDLVLPSAGV